jgi:DNA-directed RNA polymerase specialized sigma24 family protein
MAWPDDYIDWGRRARDELRQQVAAALNSLLSPHPLPGEEIKELVDLAVLEAFNLAYGHQRDPEYFPDESRFRLWLGVVAVREAVRLLLRHDRVEPRLHQLPTDQYRLLGMVYLDRLIYGDVATVLQLSADEVRRRCYEALQALCRLPRQP